MHLSVTTTPQVCFGIDYDFANHKCYLHTDSSICGPFDETILTPMNLSPMESVVNVILCKFQDLLFYDGILESVFLGSYCDMET